MGAARLQLRVHGRVQGVFYRLSAQTEARRLGLTGWVRNCPDGTVEMVAEGDRAALEQLLSYCWKGPAAARVDEIETDWGETTGEFFDLELRY